MSTLAWRTQSWPSLAQPFWPWVVTYLRNSVASPQTFIPSPPQQLICLVLKPSPPLVLTWVAAVLCLGPVLRLLVFLASLPTCLLQSSWHG